MKRALVGTKPEKNPYRRDRYILRRFVLLVNNFDPLAILR